MKKDKHGYWKEPFIVAALTTILLAIPFIFYPNEVKAVAWMGIVKFSLFIILPATIAGAIFTYVWKDDPNKEWIRKLTLFLALFFAIFVTIPASQYRQDKIDKIQYDNK